MSILVANDNIIAVTKGLHVDCYNYSKHILFEIQLQCKPQDNDKISDIIVSPNSKHLAMLTSTSKQLTVYDLPLADKFRSFDLPRSASKIRFTRNSAKILVTDKSGDVLIYDINSEEPGTKLLGHLSLLLDVLQTSDGKYIITSDRDEKIKVSCYPNTYNIQTYCLGHKEFVNHIELLPHNEECLISSSGDGTVKFWNYRNGMLCHNIDTVLDVNDDKLKDEFSKVMDEEGVEVTTLPIVFLTTTQLNSNSSLLAVAIHSFNKLLIYSLHSVDNQFRHKLEHKLDLQDFPAAIQFHKTYLYVYCNDGKMSAYNIINENDTISIKQDKSLTFFENANTGINGKEINNYEALKVLYKRKFDNVQEYQERKKQRLEKSVQ